jgi:hypothetical protein
MNSSSTVGLLSVFQALDNAGRKSVGLTKERKLIAGRLDSWCRYGEGKYGGAEQMIVTRISGEKRALSSILQNVFDAWMTYLKQPLPPVSQY